MFMKNELDINQLIVNFFSVPIEAFDCCSNFLLQQFFTLFNAGDTWSLCTFWFVAKIVLTWGPQLDTTTFLQNILLDNILYSYLVTKQAVITPLLTISYGLQTQVTSLLLNSYDYFLVAKQQTTNLTVSTYVVDILLTVIVYGFYSILFFNLIFFTKTNVGSTLTNHNTAYSKFSYLVESEEELGSVDDAVFFVSTFLVLFSWFFLTTSIFVVLKVTSFSFLSITFLLVVFFVLAIPFSVLLDFGLSFAAYIRGAGSSSNILVEVVFDLIGSLIVFTRFIVQNIRFILILWAYFELYEWFYLSPFTNLLNTLLDIHPSGLFDNFLTLQISGSHLVKLLSGIITYAYYFLHLLALLFIQLGAYFLISFWLFFFFYTSFYLEKSEKLFFFKRYINVN